MKHFALFLACFFIGINGYSQNDEGVASLLVDGAVKMDHAVKHWNKSEMDEAKILFGKAGRIAPENHRVLYWDAYANYRLAIYYLFAEGAMRNEKSGEQHIKDAITSLEKAIDLNSEDADTYALLGSLTGMKILLNPISAMWLGPKSNGFFDRAASLDNKNPRVFYLKGVSKLKAPSMFGGGPEKAISQFEKAISLFEAEKLNISTDPLIPRWGLDECYSFLGNALEKQGEFEKARVSYKKALEINPNSNRAKMELASLQNK